MYWLIEIYVHQNHADKLCQRFNISLTFLGEENLEVLLAQIRKHRYMKMVTTLKKGLQPERLPPTENEIEFHPFRVYLQI